MQIGVLMMLFMDLAVGSSLWDTWCDVKDLLALDCQ